MPEVNCPHCEAPVSLSIAAAVGNKQKFSYRVYPESQNMMQAEAIGGQLVAMDKLMRAVAREDGGKVRTYIDRAVTHDDGSIEFFLVVLPVVAWDDKKGKFVASKPNVTRDSDGSPKGGDAVAAPFMGSAVGEAETPHTSPPSSPKAG